MRLLVTMFVSLLGSALGARELLQRQGANSPVGFEVYASKRACRRSETRSVVARFSNIVPGSRVASCTVESSVSFPNNFLTGTPEAAAMTWLKDDLDISSAASSGNTFFYSLLAKNGRSVTIIGHDGESCADAIDSDIDEYVNKIALGTDKCQKYTFGEFTEFDDDEDEDEADNLTVYVRATN